MRIRMIAALLLMSWAVGPAVAQSSQERGGVRTETMARLAGQGADNDLIWNAIGLLGLLGLMGLRKQHADDSYHPASME
jgi:hypothetical protein